VCLTCSAGGHLTELLQLENAWKKHEYFWVSDNRANAIELGKRVKMYYVVVPRRNPLKLLVNFFQAFWIFLKEKPDVLISTGADVSIPLLLISKLFFKKIVFIESFCRVKSPSLSGKIMYPLADLFLVQWPENLEFFPKAEFAGSVF